MKDFLGTTQMFRGLPPEQLDAVAEIAIYQTYAKKETIFLEGEEGRGFFIIVSGRVKVFKLSADGKEQILHFFESGDHFAEVPAFDGECFPASAAALEKTEVLFFPRETFLKLLENHPSLAINLLSIFARYLRRFAKLIDDLSLKEVPGRLAVYLLELSASNDGNSEVKLTMTKGQLAARLGTIPETLSRVLAKMSKDGLIAINGSSIRLLDRNGLIVLAGDSYIN